MKLSKARQNDLETVMYFIHPSMKKIIITDKDIEMFFENSEKGMHKELIDKNKMDGFNTLIQGKEWRGVHMQMYEDGVISGDMPYSVILQEIPESVVEFMKKEMFKGKDSEIITNIYKKYEQMEK